MPDTRTTSRTAADLSGPELRFLRLLRLWGCGPDAQADAWSDLTATLGAARARACLSAFETLSGHIRRAAWVRPVVSAPEARALTADEDGICRIVDAAARGEREEALLHASFLVRPDALLPLLHAAERTGLPLLCADCRARLAQCRTRTN